MNPYWDQDFFGFFIVLFKRFVFVLSGMEPCVSDEIQIGTLSLIAISCGVLGPFLVLKKMTMLANSLSHTILLGLGMSYLFFQHFFGLERSLSGGSLVFGALIAALVTTALTSFLTKQLRLQVDASIGLVFTFLFSLGIVFVTLFMRDVHLGVEAVTGNVDMLHKSDLVLSLYLAGGVLFAVVFFFGPLQCFVFDSLFALSLGLPCKFLQALLLLLTAGATIGAFRAVGVLLVLSFLVGPYLIARLFCDKLISLLVVSASIGVFASLMGVALSRHMLSVREIALSTGGIISVLIACFYLLARFFTRFRCTVRS